VDHFGFDGDRAEYQIHQGLCGIIGVGQIDPALRFLFLEPPGQILSGPIAATLMQQRTQFRELPTDDIRNTITRTTETMTLLIAVISLLVGGIGVMNIMLVSVVERTAEIGVRMAVGARRSDILQQFLIEAVLVCIVGGILGIAMALGFGVVFAALGSSFTLIYSSTAIALAFVCSTLVGVIFGYLPARNAALLDPVAALSRE